MPNMGILAGLHREAVVDTAVVAVDIPVEDRDMEKVADTATVVVGTPVEGKDTGKAADIVAVPVRTVEAVGNHIGAQDAFWNS
jgi:hypothetical protein